MNIERKGDDRIVFFESINFLTDRYFVEIVESNFSTNSWELFSCSFQCPLKKNKRNIFIYVTAKEKNSREFSREFYYIRILIFALEDKIKEKTTPPGLTYHRRNEAIIIVEVRLGKSVRRSSVVGVSSNFPSFATSLGAEETF